MLVKETVTITENIWPPAGRTDEQILTARKNNERNKGVIFKNCVLFTKCSSFNLIEYSKNYSKNIWTFMAVLQRWVACCYTKFWIIQIQDKNNRKDPCWRLYKGC